MDASYWIDKLGLKKHPEGGAFVETYRSPLIINCSEMGIQGSRNLATSIYFLLKSEGFSAFHRIKSDEAWHFYTGDPVLILEIDEEGQLQEQILGSNPEKNETFQHVVKAGRWFAAKVMAENSYSLVGCTVSPGFDFHDFELADRGNLINLYPNHASIITQFSYS